VEETALLLAIQRVVGGIEVQHEFGWGSLEAGDELLDQHFVQAPGAVVARIRAWGYFVLDAATMLHWATTGGASNVRHVFCNGVQLVADGRLTQHDAAEIVRAAQH
jgi:hypothetical protein